MVRQPGGNGCPEKFAGLPPFLAGHTKGISALPKGNCFPHRSIPLPTPIPVPHPRKALSCSCAPTGYFPAGSGVYGRNQPAGSTERIPDGTCGTQPLIRTNREAIHRPRPPQHRPEYCFRNKGYPGAERKLIPPDEKKGSRPAGRNPLRMFVK